MQRFAIVLLSLTACFHFEDTQLGDDNGRVDAAVVDATLEVPDATPPFNIAITPTDTRLLQDSSFDVTVTISRINSFSLGQAVISLNNPPEGISAQDQLVGMTDSVGTLTVIVGPNAAQGVVDLEVQVDVIETGAQAREAVALLVAGTPGSIDTSFADAGTFATDDANKTIDIEVAGTGRILIATNKDGVSQIIALTPDGDLDLGFGTDGILSLVDLDLVAIAARDDGGVIAACNTGAGLDAKAVARVYTAQGVLDESFSGGGILTPPSNNVTTVFDIAVAGNGRIYLAGSKNNVSSIFRFSPTGEFQNDRGSGQANRFLGIATTKDRAFVVANSNSEPQSIVLGFHLDLSTDEDYGLFGTARIGGERVDTKRMAVGADRAIAITSNAVSGPEALHISFVGIAGQTLGQNSYVSPAPQSDIVFDATGRILAVTTQNAQTGRNTYLYRMGNTGAPDTSFAMGGTMKLTGNNGSDDIAMTRIALQQDGRIILGGRRGNTGTTDDWILQRYWD